MDDTEKGIGFKDFEIVETLGQGTFGRVFKVVKRSDGRVFAMKVLRKAYLAKNNHLKYAVTECNVLKMSDHPFIIKLHYSF